LKNLSVIKFDVYTLHDEGEEEPDEEKEATSLGNGVNASVNYRGWFSLGGV
jgi:hypothetical protein